MHLSALGALLFLTASAPEEPTATELRYFEMFDSFCISTLGAPDAAQAAAAAAGWRPLPESVIAQVTTPVAPVVQGRSGPSLLGNGAPVVLFSATATEGDLTAHTCVLDVGNLPQMDAAHLEALVSSRLGIAATQSRLGPVWAYSGPEPFTGETALASRGEEAMTAESLLRPVAMIQIKVHQGRPFLNLTRMGR